MLLKNDGLVLAELLLSLSSLLMIGLFFTPLLIDLNTQTRNLMVEKQANQFLYEELQTYLVNPLAIQNHSTRMNGIDYQITWRDIDTGKKEVCVKGEDNHFHLEKNICQTSE